MAMGASAGLNIRVDSSSIPGAINDLSQLGGSAGSTEEAINRLGGASTSFQQRVSSLGAAVADFDRRMDAAGGAANLTSQQLGQMADAALNASSGIRTAGTAATGLGAAGQASTGGLRLMRGGVQNLSWQLQDVVIQLQAGQNWAIIFAQQGSQIASAFGPAGAALGLFIAIAGGLAGVFLRGRSASDDLSAATEALEQAQSALGSVITEQISNVDDLTEAYARLSSGQRGLEIGELTQGAEALTAQIVEQQDAVDELLERMQRIARLDVRFADINPARLGPPEVAAQIDQLVESYQAGERGAGDVALAIQRLREESANSTEEFREYDAELNALVNTLQELQTELENVERAQGALARAGGPPMPLDAAQMRDAFSAIETEGGGAIETLEEFRAAMNRIDVGVLAEARLEIDQEVEGLQRLVDASKEGEDAFQRTEARLEAERIAHELNARGIDAEIDALARSIETREEANETIRDYEQAQRAAEAETARLQRAEERATERRLDAIATLDLEVDALNRLAAAKEAGPVEERRERSEIEAERFLARHDFTRGNAEGDRAWHLVMERERLEALDKRREAVEKLRFEIEDLRRVEAARHAGPAERRRIQTDIEVQGIIRGGDFAGTAEATEAADLAAQREGLQMLKDRRDAVEQLRLEVEGLQRVEEARIGGPREVRRAETEVGAEAFLRGADLEGTAEADEAAWLFHERAAIGRIESLRELEGAIDPVVARQRDLLEMETNLTEAREMGLISAERQTELMQKYALSLEPISPLMRDLEQVGANTFRNLEDALIDVTSGTESFGDAFTDLVAGMLRDMQRLAIREMITRPLMEMFTVMLRGQSMMGGGGGGFAGGFGGGGGGGGAGLGLSVVGTIAAGALTGGLTGGLGGAGAGTSSGFIVDPFPFRAQHGLDYMVTGGGGPDSVSMPLMVTPGERVRVETPQQQRVAQGGHNTTLVGSMNISAPNAAPGIEQRIRREVVAALRQVRSEMVPSLVDALDRDGDLASTLGA